MCGGTPCYPSEIAFPEGLSPRVRGNHGVVLVSGLIMRSIPACAGEPVSPRSPHVVIGGLSPRVRGNRYST